MSGIDIEGAIRAASGRKARNVKVQAFQIESEQPDGDST